jgi:zeta-carotene desaturase
MRVAIAGAGVAGLAAAWVLAEEGHEVDLYEARRIGGGRATSYEVPVRHTNDTLLAPERSERITERVDNSQHILMRCCTNLLDLLHRLGAQHLIEFHDTFTFIEPGGRRSVLKAGILPAPLHFAGAFLGLKFLTLKDKLAIARGMAAIRRDIHRGPELDHLTMAAWLQRHGQTEAALRLFWEPVLISAVNERLEIISAWQGIGVLHLGFVAGKRNYEMGVPTVLLGDLWSLERFARHPRLRVHPGLAASGFEANGASLAGLRTSEGLAPADAVISALPYERLAPLFPELGLRIEPFAHSPIAGIHLRFDRPVTTLPHAALLGRTIQWFFAKEGGAVLSIVVSVSRTLETMRREEILALAVRELAEFLPAVADAHLLAGHVIRETRATFVASPGFEAQRPGPETRFSNFFLAGEWTRTGWPSTMEGAVISGYRAGEAVCRLAGAPRNFVTGTAPLSIR